MNILRTALLSFVLFVGVGVALANWTQPSAVPPNNNTPPPVNIGATAQTKDRNLFLSAGHTFSSTLGLFGQIGISTTSPASSLKLGVEGNIGAVAYCDVNGKNCATPPFGGGGGTPPVDRTWTSFQTPGRAPGADRHLNTNYINNTGHEILVTAWTYSGCVAGNCGGNASFFINPVPSHCAASMKVDGILISYQFTNTAVGANSMCQATGVVPDGSTYRIGNDGWADIKLFGWSELR